MPFVGVGAKSWQCGGATIKGDGVDAYFQYFEITHNFLVIPYYVEGEYNDLIAGIKAKKPALDPATETCPASWLRTIIFDHEEPRKYVV